MRYFDFVPDGTSDCCVKAGLQTGMEEIAEAFEDRPAVVICPGGGYEFLSEREAAPVAKEYIAAGYHVFVLYYSICEGAKGFRPLCQLASTIAHIRKHAEEWKVCKDKISVCGFSAGGHLAASSGTLFNEKEFLEAYKGDPDIRPDAMILGYPVILADEYAHVGSIEHVSGAKEGSSGYGWFGLEKHVDENTPPAFLWHTAEDDCVPVENSLKFACALSAAKVPFELHVLPKGGHGMSVCTREVNTPDSYNARWVGWSIEWLNKLFSFEK